MPYYWLYYLAPMVLAFAQRQPMIALVALGFVALRPWLPDPAAIWRALVRAGRLKREASLNPANVIARRNLGMIYLDLRRPRTALRYLDEARERDPRNQDIAFLRGRALLLRGDAEAALKAFGEAVGVDPETGEQRATKEGRSNARAFTRDAEAFLAAASALEQLGRLAEAEEALRLAADYNTSLIEPQVRLARLRRRRGDRAGARDAFEGARKTFSQLPGFLKRKQVGWWFKTWVG